MRVEHLSLKNYRNYSKLDISLSPNLNIFIGDNAQGKSNILESIVVLALTKSYMNVKDQNLIKDEERYSFLRASFFSGNSVENIVEIAIAENDKKLKLNGKEITKFRDYISKLKVLIFSPYNVNFIKEGPSVRRKNVDVVISQLSNVYVELLQHYNAVLKKRNQFLKSAKHLSEEHQIFLDTLNARFCSLAVDIVRERYRFCFKINQLISDVYQELTDDVGLVFQYITKVEYCEDKEIMLKNFRMKLNSVFEQEKLYGMTLVGPHRDNFSFLLKEKDLAIYGSQGQIRAAILALKLSEMFLFKELDGDYPILLLDDVFSELDGEKRNRLVKYILDDVQTIITTTDIDRIDNSLVDRAKVFTVCNGMIVDDGKRECKNE